MILFKRKNKKKKSKTEIAKNKPDLAHKSLNLTRLTFALSKQFNLSKAESERIIQFIIRSIAETIKIGGRVRLRNFGTYELKKSRGKLRPKFKASKNMLKTSKSKK